MKQSNTIGVDLAKNVIQISEAAPSNRELSNRELSRLKFAEFLAKQKPALVAFEACATAHHWARVASSHGHTVKIIPAIAVAPFRQGHKTDQNDALAVAEAANRPNIKIAALKGIDQQAMQAVHRSRELIIQDRTALSNHIRGLLLEFGIVIPKGFTYLRTRVPLVLEEADNGLPMAYRPTLQRMFQRFLALEQDLVFMDEQIASLVKSNDGCRRLLALECVGPMGAVLIQGASSYVRQHKYTESSKDAWMFALKVRAGTGPGYCTRQTQTKEFNSEPRSDKAIHPGQTCPIIGPIRASSHRGTGVRIH